MDSAEPERRVPITGLHVAALRALLARRGEEYRELAGRLVSDDDHEGLLRLVYAAFFEAVDRRFAEDGQLAGEAAIIDFVAEVRAGSAYAAEEIDPAHAERIISFLLGRGGIGDIDHDAGTRCQIVLLVELIEAADLGDTGLDAFVAKARSMAEAW